MKGRARTNADFERIYGSVERTKWIQSLPCVACGSGPCENAHIKTGGTGYKADYIWIVPLCGYCHRWSHQMGQKSFEEKMHVDLAEKAEYIQTLWEEHETRNCRP